jgi:hypothetical protein
MYSERNDKNAKKFEIHTGDEHKGKSKSEAEAKRLKGCETPLMSGFKNALTESTPEFCLRAAAPQSEGHLMPQQFL